MRLPWVLCMIITNWGSPKRQLQSMNAIDLNPQATLLDKFIRL